jgi:hypothetical protein
VVVVQSPARVFAILVGVVRRAVFVHQDFRASIATSFRVQVDVDVDLVFVSMLINASAIPCFLSTNLVDAQFRCVQALAIMEDNARLWATWVHVLAPATGPVSLAASQFAKQIATFMELVLVEFVIAVLDGRVLTVIFLFVQLVVIKGPALHQMLVLATKDGEVINANFTSALLHSVQMPILLDVTGTAGRVDAVFELAIVLRLP